MVSAVSLGRRGLVINYVTAAKNLLQVSETFIEVAERHRLEDGPAGLFGQFLQCRRSHQWIEFVFRAFLSTHRVHCDLAPFGCINRLLERSPARVVFAIADYY